jgi:WD40 repeat protein
MDADSGIRSVAVSRDGKWAVSGTSDGWVWVWNAKSHSQVSRFKAHNDWVRTVDVSPDGMRIASGSDDSSACVWSLSAGQRLFEPFKRSILPNPFKHGAYVVAVKFSPDGQLIALAKQPASVRICDGHDGHLLVQFPIKVDSFMNQSLAWTKDSKQLFVLSGDGNIYRLEVSTGATLSQWLVNSTKDAHCIALASNGTFIAASGGSLVSFWDTTTYKKIECVIYHDDSAVIESMAISSNYDLVTAGGTKLTIRNLRDWLPSPYCDEVSALIHCAKWLPNHKLLVWLRLQFSEVEIARMGVENSHPKEINESRRTEESSSAFVYSLTHCIHIRAQLGSKIAHLEGAVEVLRQQLTTSQRIANQKEDSLNETITSLRADLHTQETSSSAFIDIMHRASLMGFLSIEPKKIANLEETVQELRNQLATFQYAANQEKDSFNETINSLRADLRAEKQSSGAFIATLTCAALTSTSGRQQNHTSRTHSSRTQRPTQRVPPQN